MILLHEKNIFISVYLRGAMQKIYLIIVLLLCLPNGSYANEKSEINSKKNFEIFKEIMYPINNNNIPNIEKLDIAMDYAVEILKTKPDSLEAYYVLDADYEIESNEVAFKKYLKLRKKLFNNLTNPNTNTAEKLFFLNIALYKDSKYTGYSDLSLKNNEKFIHCILKIRMKCKDPNYRALAALIPVYDLLEYEYFIDHFPNHAAIPFIKLIMYEALIIGDNFDEAIKKILKSLEQYKNIKYLNGKDYYIQCYYLLARAYFGKKEFEKSFNYMMTIKEKAPQYFNEGFYEVLLHKLNKLNKAE